MPNLLRLMLQHGLIGFAIALGFTALILAFDIANLRTLASQSGAGVAAIALLAFFIGTTFAGAQIGFAVFSDRKDEEE